MLILPAAMAAVVTFSLIYLLLRSRLSVKIRDIPNARSLHAEPTPRIGGIGMVAGIVAGWLCLADAMTWWLLLPLLGLSAMSLLDDMRGLAVGIRLGGQMLCAVILLAGAGMFQKLGVPLTLLLLLSVVWIINLYNFMDGSDGLAGGMALFGFAAYGAAALYAGNVPLAALSFAVSGAAAGFLCFNFPPARVFMGDAGSIPLGFLVAALGLAGWQQGCWEAWFPLLVFSPFVMDATVTLLKRSLRGVPITVAHRDHYYQRAVRMGWGHGKVARAEYALMFFSGLSAVLALRQGGEVFWLVTWTLCYAVLMRAIDNRWEQVESGGK
ncbi:MAG: glycosyltransferase family 4 protein [Halothiobacillaceae bacterium]|nr:glycosyltransferase family 4 protein [Halothiobacillaceae bacterium]